MHTALNGRNRICKRDDHDAVIVENLKNVKECGQAVIWRRIYRTSIEKKNVLSSAHFLLRRTSTSIQSNNIVGSGASLVVISTHILTDLALLALLTLRRLLCSFWCCSLLRCSRLHLFCSFRLSRVHRALQ